MPSVESPERANPYRGHADLALEKVEESGSLLHHQVDILDDQFVMNSEQPPPDFPQSNARFPVDRFFVERRVQVLAPSSRRTSGFCACSNREHQNQSVSHRQM